MGDEEENDLDVHICQHNSCSCLIRGRADEYCSEHCKNAGDAEQSACHCGHKECEEQHQTLA